MIAEKIAIHEEDPPGEQLRVIAYQPGHQRLLSCIGGIRRRAEDRPPGAGGHQQAPQVRERSFLHDLDIVSLPCLAFRSLALPLAVLADSGAGEDRQVPRRGRNVQLESVHRAQRPPGDHHRAGRAVFGERPGDPPEQLLQRPCPEPRRHAVIVLCVGTCHLLAQGSRGSSPARTRITSG